jgi:hypothetical protein
MEREILVSYLRRDEDERWIIESKMRFSINVSWLFL